MKTLTLNMPSDTKTETLKIVLNGKDVTSRFNTTSCAAALCETGTLSSADGLRAGKNVLYVVAKVIPISGPGYAEGQSEAESQAGLIPRGSAHAHSVGHGFVAFLWQIPPIGPVFPVLPTYNCFAVNNLRVDCHSHGGSRRFESCCAHHKINELQRITKENEGTKKAP